MNGHSTGPQHSTVRKGIKGTVSVCTVLDVGRDVGKWSPCSCMAVERSLLKQSLMCRLVEWGSRTGSCPHCTASPRSCFEPPLEAGFRTSQTFGSPTKPLLLASVVCSLPMCALFKGVWKEETMNYLQKQSKHHPVWGSGPTLLFGLLFALSITTVTVCRLTAQIFSQSTTCTFNYHHRFLTVPTQVWHWAWPLAGCTGSRHVSDPAVRAAFPFDPLQVSVKKQEEPQQQGLGLPSESQVPQSHSVPQLLPFWNIEVFSIYLACIQWERYSPPPLPALLSSSCPFSRATQILIEPPGSWPWLGSCGIIDMYLSSCLLHILSRRTLWETVSKALLESKIITSTGFPWSRITIMIGYLVLKGN